MRAPVDDVVAAIYEPFVIEPDEYFLDRVAETLVHGETFPLPVKHASKFFELVDDDRAMMLFPLPDPLDEFFAAEFPAAGPFFGELFLDDVLGRDTGVVGAAHPLSVVALEPFPANYDVLNSVVQGVSHVEDSGDVRRRNYYRKRLAAFG